MKRILVLTVGGSSEPVVHAIQQNKEVAFVYFLCSTGAAGSDRTIEQTTQFQQKGRCPKCNETYTTSIETPPIRVKAGLSEGQYQVVRIEYPDELGSVFDACQEVARDIEARFGDQAIEVVANYTGGTKTMSVGLGSYALQPSCSWGLQTNVSGKGRDNLVKITAGDIATRQDTLHYDLSAMLDQARTLERRHDFEGAVALLEGHAAGTSLDRTTRRQVNDEVARLRLLAACDRLDFEEAEQAGQTMGDKDEAKRARALNSLRREITSSSPWRPRDKTGVELVAEVIDSARRRASVGHFDDAAARLYRATELLAQARLKKHYNIVTSDVRLDGLSIPPETRAALEAQRRGDGGPIQIALMDDYRLLRDLGDPLGTYASGRRLDELKTFLEKRNFSFLAHGTTPISASDWDAFGARWLAWLDEACAIAAGPAPVAAR